MTALESSVSAVIVFQRGAAVTRTATARPQAGALAFEGLPLCVDDDSVRIELGRDAAGAGWSVSDVQVEVDAPSPVEIPEPEDEIEIADAEDARDRARAQVRATEASMQALRTVELEPRRHEREDHRPTHDPTAGRLAWLKQKAESLSDLQATLVRQRRVLDEASEALQVLLDARQARSSDRDPRAFEPRKKVTLRLAAGEAVENVPIALSYRVPGARWAPSYVLRLDGGDRAALQLRAVVGQRTGEDWSGAKLTVSTASWLSWYDLPRLDALRVGRAQAPAARAGWREPPPDPDGLYADYDRFAHRLDVPDDLLMDAPADALDEPEMERSPPAPRAPSAPPQSAPAPAGAGGVPPLPAPLPRAPMPLAAAAAPEPEMARSGFGSARARPKMKEQDASFATELFDADDEFAELPEPEPEHGLGRSWFDYGRLRLPLASEGYRGRLRRVALITASGEVDRLAAIVLDAQRRARELESDALPAGHAWVRARPGHAYAYACDAAVDIPSDGQGHVVAVLDAEVETRRSHVCVPGVSSDVFRTLSARNPLSMPLPAGPLDVYDGDDFLLSGAVDAAGAGGRFEIGLGVEQAIKVARNVAFSEESEGLIKRSNAYAHHITIDIQNLLAAPASIEVRERVPVPASNEDDIEVEESGVEPPWDLYRPKDEPLEGGRRWRIEVPAGAKKTLRTTYTVRVPGGSELVGGNRRDG